MAFEEKRAWIMLVVAIVAYTIYLGIVLGRRGDASLVEVSYAATLLWTIGGAILASIALHVVIALAAPEDADHKDERDREINRLGEYIGQSFVVIGGVAALLMAMAELDHFWIANAVYLAFVASAILGSITKIVAYRRGFQSW